MKFCVNALAVTLLLSAPAVIRAELVFTPASDFSGDVRVTQTPLGDWVNILVEYQVSTNVGTLGGGFRPLDGAVFNQGEGQLDTTFLLPPNAIILPPVADTAEELSVSAATVFLGNLAEAGEHTPLAQLVLAPGTTAEMFGPGADSVPGLQLANSGGVIGAITGSVTAVPEPSAMAGVGLALLGWVGVRYRRRRRLALA